jgi:hypothetical protein
MALLGSAALAMWWNVSAADRPELEHWHAHEHFPERLGLPGFRRASRWTDAEGGEGFFVMYELADYAVLASPAYVERLNAPSAWSTRMMPLHRNMVRCQCRVLRSHGAFTARHALTLRGSAAQDFGHLTAAIVQRPGIVGLHVLRHEPPALAATTEQRIRGNADRAADWIVVACGYDAAALRELLDGDLAAAAAGAEVQLFSLAYSATPPDVV